MAETMWKVGEAATHPTRLCSSISVAPSSN